MEDTIDSVVASCGRYDEAESAYSFDEPVPSPSRAHRSPGKKAKPSAGRTRSPSKKKQTESTRQSGVISPAEVIAVDATGAAPSSFVSIGVCCFLRMFSFEIECAERVY